MSENVHSKHRQRVKKRFIEDGNLDSFEDHKILEMLLFYCYARCDTNEIAHRLINEFGGFYNLLESSPQEICKRCGVTENVAVLISMIPHVSKRYFTGKWSKREEMSNSRTVGEYCVGLYAGIYYECFYVVCLDNQRRLIRAELVHKGTIDSSAIYPRLIVECALKNKAASVIVSHNHPSGSLVPSKSDIDATKKLKEALKTVEIALVDHVIVGGDKYYSFVEKKLPF